MMNVSVARRYARALLAAAGDQADTALGQLDAIVTFLESNAPFYEALVSPALTRAQRQALTEGLISASPGLVPPLANLLKLLTDRNRASVLPSLLRLYRLAVDAKVGRVRGTVTSAVPLSTTQLDALRTQLETLSKQQVLLNAQVDKSLLGGVVAQVGSRMYDGSLRSQLNTLAQQLAAPVR